MRHRITPKEASSPARISLGREGILGIAVALVLACVAPEARAGALAAIAERLPASVAPAVTELARELACGRAAPEPSKALSHARRKAWRTGAPTWAHGPVLERLDATTLEAARGARFSRIHAIFGPDGLDATLALWDGAAQGPDAVAAQRPALAGRAPAPVAPPSLRSRLELTPARAQAP